MQKIFNEEILVAFDGHGGNALDVKKRKIFIKTSNELFE